MAKRPREMSISEHSHHLKLSEPGSIAHPPKFTLLDMPDEKGLKMQCSLPPHKILTFNSYVDYETHYNQSHTNRCSVCRKNFPSGHLLDLHQSENHDPLMSMKRDQGEKTLSCFVEGCDKVCMDWQKRRNHLVDKHGFPKNYDYFVVTTGIDGKRSMLRAGIDSQGHRKSSRERRISSGTIETQTTEATSTGQQSEDLTEVLESPPKASKPAEGEDPSLNAITKSISSLQFVPRSVTFGKRKGNSGFANS